MVTTLTIQLHSNLDYFVLKRAQELSTHIHILESEGFELSAIEEQLWKRLTNRIEAWRLID